MCACGVCKSIEELKEDIELTCFSGPPKASLSFFREHWLLRMYVYVFQCDDDFRIISAFGLCFIVIFLEPSSIVFPSFAVLLTFISGTFFKKEKSSPCSSRRYLMASHFGLIFFPAKRRAKLWHHANILSSIFFREPRKKYRVWGIEKKQRFKFIAERFPPRIYLGNTLKDKFFI